MNVFFSLIIIAYYMDSLPKSHSDVLFRVTVNPDIPGIIFKSCSSKKTKLVSNLYIVYYNIYIYICVHTSVYTIYIYIYRVYIYIYYTRYNTQFIDYIYIYSMLSWFFSPPDSRHGTFFSWCGFSASHSKCVHRNLSSSHLFPHRGTP